MKKVLFVLTSAAVIGPDRRATGYEFSEVADPYAEFERAGYTIDFASPRGGNPPAHGYDPAAPVSQAFREGPGYARLTESQPLATVDLTPYDALFFPGGLGPMADLATSAPAKRLIVAAYERGLVLGAVCHGPVALLHARLPSGELLVAGKRLTSFTPAEEAAEGNPLGRVLPFLLTEELARQGALLTHAPPFEAHTVVDGRLVTGQNPASAAPVAREMLRLLA